jgi:hypothetical protein
MDSISPCLAALRPHVSTLARHDDHKPFLNQNGHGTGNRAASQAVLLDKAPLRWHGPTGYQLSPFDLSAEDSRELLRERHRAKRVDFGHARQLRGS